MLLVKVNIMFWCNSRGDLTCITCTSLVSATLANMSEDSLLYWTFGGFLDLCLESAVSPRRKMVPELCLANQQISQCLKLHPSFKIAHSPAEAGEACPQALHPSLPRKRFYHFMRLAGGFSSSLSPFERRRRHGLIHACVLSVSI